MFFRLIAADIWGLLRKQVIAFAAIGAVSVANLVYAYGLSSTYGVDTSHLSFADNLALVFAGSTPFEFKPGVMFIPPLGWLFLVLLILYTTIDYPTEPMRGIGLQVLVRCRSRRVWLLSRYIVVLIMTAAAFAMTVAVSAAWTSLGRGSFDMLVHGDALRLANLGPDFLEATQADGFLFFAGVLIALEAFAFIQTSIGFMVGPSVSFAISLAYLVVSSYARHWALLGNALMLLRWGDLVKGGVCVGSCAALSFLLATVCVMFSGLWFSRADVIRKLDSL